MPQDTQVDRVDGAVTAKVGIRIGAEEHLPEQGRIRYSLKTPWRDGTTHVVFEPLDFIARLAALDCMDAGGRATQEQLPRSLGPAST